MIVVYVIILSLLFRSWTAFILLMLMVIIFPMAISMMKKGVSLNVRHGSNNGGRD